MTLPPNNRKGSFDTDKVFSLLDQPSEEGNEPGKIAKNLLDSVIESVLRLTNQDDEQGDPKMTVDEANEDSKQKIGQTNAPNSFHDIMNVSDYHILYNFVKTRLDIAVHENEHLESIARILYGRSKELILDPNGVTNGKIKVLERSLLHEVIGFHRNYFHDNSDDNGNEFDCGCLLVKMLLSYNADVNAKDKYGTTPFHEAAANHCERTLKMLLGTGRVNVAEKDSEGESALYYLVENITDSKTDENQTDVLVKRLEACLRILLENGLDFKETGRNGDTVFHRMLQNYFVGLPLVICFVEMCGPDVSHKNKFGHTPLHVCVRAKSSQFNRERIDILRYLCILSSKETLDLKDVSSKTALIHSIISENKLLCRILFSNGADIELKDKHGMSPLHYACMSQDTSVVETLLDCEVNIKSTDHVGDYAIVYAAAHGRIDIVNKLYPLYDEESHRELHNRLLTVADFNGHRECHEVLKMIKEWDIIDLDHVAPTITKISPASFATRKVLKIEVEVREVDAWLRQKQEYLRKNRRLYFISPIEKFHILQSLRENENHELCDAVTDLVSRVADAVNDRDTMFRFKPILVGSMAEETKIDQVDLLEFHCEMYELSQNFEIVKEETPPLTQMKTHQQMGVVPGYTRIIAQNDSKGMHTDTSPQISHHEDESNNDDIDENKESSHHQQSHQLSKNLIEKINNVSYLSSFNVIRIFTKVVNEVLCDERIWENLQLSWEPPDPTDNTTNNHHTSTITVRWVGKNYKYKKVQICLIPTVFSMEECQITSHLSKLLGGLGVIENARSAATRLIAQRVKSLDADKPDLLWKKDHTPFELSIFNSVPESVLEGYKLAKLIRSEKICPRLFNISSFPKLSLKAVEYLSNQLLKTSLFYELTARLDVGGLDYLRQTDSVGWAFHILNRIGNSFERATTNSALPDFFDHDVNLKDDRMSPFVYAVSKIGRSWLRHQWEDLYGGRKLPVEEKLLFADTSSPKL